MPAPNLSCEHVSYAYEPGRWANREVTFDVRAGEIFCLLGPNGAGKSTLLRQMTGHLRPTTGRIRILGLDAFGKRDQIRKSLGVIPQDVGLFQPLTVTQHLRHFASLKGVARSQRDAVVSGLVEECGLGELFHKRVASLSVGERRRLLVALALIGDPPILVLDEPTVGLDPVARRGFWETLERQRDRGKSIVLTTHYLDEVEHLADRVAILEDGALLRCSSLDELYAATGKTVKVTNADGDGAVYFDSVQEASTFVAEGGMKSFLMSRVTLEDIYLRLFGKAFEQAHP